MCTNTYTLPAFLALQATTQTEPEVADRYTLADEDDRRCGAEGEDEDSCGDEDASKGSDWEDSILEKDTGHQDC